MLPLFALPWIALASPTAPSMTAGADCAEASRAAVEVVGGYDQVRVVTAPGAPRAALVVTVVDRDGWSSFTARAGGTSSLSVAGGGGGGAVTLAIEPDLDAPSGACALKLELMRGGEVVAAVDLAPAPVAGS